MTTNIKERCSCNNWFIHLNTLSFYISNIRKSKLNLNENYTIQKLLSFNLSLNFVPFKNVVWVLLLFVGNEDPKCNKQDGQEPMSMPHMSVNNQTFSYKNPAYQSAHPQIHSDLNEIASNNSNTTTTTTASTKQLTSKSDDSFNRSNSKQSQQQDNKGKSILKALSRQAMPIGENYEVNEKKTSQTLLDNCFITQ